MNDGCLFDCNHHMDCQIYAGGRALIYTHTRFDPFTTE